jgi:hypothetical protein
MEVKKMSREDLYSLVWAKPTREVAKEFGISDVGLGKICNRINVPKPPPGYWARIAAGYKVKTPRLPPIKKGQRNEVEIWPTVKKANAETRNPIVVDLLEREKLTDNRIVVAEDLHGAHNLVSCANKILSQGKPDSYGRLMIPWKLKVDHPLLDLRVSKQALHRTLRIMDALIKAMLARGYEIEDDPIRNVPSGAQQIVIPRFQVNDVKLAFFVREKVDRSEREPTQVDKARPWSFERWEFIPTGELSFTIDEYRVDRKNWRDRKNKPLENQLNDIVAGLISGAESIRIRNLEREAEKQRRLEAELRRQELERIAKIERERITELEAHFNFWLRSGRLKEFLRECESYLTKANSPVVAGEFEMWLKWAHGHADSLDPLNNGELEQTIRKHSENLSSDHSAGPKK